MRQVLLIVAALGAGVQAHCEGDSDCRSGEWCGYNPELGGGCSVGCRPYVGAGRKCGKADTNCYMDKCEPPLKCVGANGAGTCQTEDYDCNSDWETWDRDHAYHCCGEGKNCCVEHPDCSEEQYCKAETSKDGKCLSVGRCVDRAGEGTPCTTSKGLKCGLAWCAGDYFTACVEYDTPGSAPSTPAPPSIPRLIPFDLSPRSSICAYNCSSGDEKDWDTAKADFCCDREQIGCKWCKKDRDCGIGLFCQGLAEKGVCGSMGVCRKRAPDFATCEDGERDWCSRVACQEGMTCQSGRCWWEPNPCATMECKKGETCHVEHTMCLNPPCTPPDRGLCAPVPDICLSVFECDDRYVSSSIPCTSEEVLDRTCYTPGKQPCKRTFCRTAQCGECEKNEVCQAAHLAGTTLCSMHKKCTPRRRKDETCTAIAPEEECDAMVCEEGLYCRTANKKDRIGSCEPFLCGPTQEPLWTPEMGALCCKKRMTNKFGCPCEKDSDCPDGFCRQANHPSGGDRCSEEKICIPNTSPGSPCGGSGCFEARCGSESMCELGVCTKPIPCSQDSNCPDTFFCQRECPPSVCMRRAREGEDCSGVVNCVQRKCMEGLMCSVDSGVCAFPVDCDSEDVFGTEKATWCCRYANKWCPCTDDMSCPKEQFCRFAKESGGGCSTRKVCAPRSGLGGRCGGLTRACDEARCMGDRKVWCTAADVPGAVGRCALQPTKCSLGPCREDQACSLVGSKVECSNTCCRAMKPQCREGFTESKKPCTAEEVATARCSHAGECCERVYCRRPIECSRECTPQCPEGTVPSALPCTPVDSAAGMCEVSTDCCRQAQCRRRVSSLEGYAEKDGMCLELATGVQVEKVEGGCGLTAPQYIMIPEEAVPSPPDTDPCASAPCGELLCVPTIKGYECARYSQPCCSEPPQCKDGTPPSEKPCSGETGCTRVVKCCITRYCHPALSTAPSPTMAQGTSSDSTPVWIWALVGVGAAAVIGTAVLIFITCRRKPSLTDMKSGDAGGCSPPAVVVHQPYPESADVDEVQQPSPAAAP